MLQPSQDKCQTFIYLLTVMTRYEGSVRQEVTCSAHFLPEVTGFAYCATECNKNYKNIFPEFLAKNERRHWSCLDGISCRFQETQLKNLTWSMHNILSGIQWHH